MWCHRVHGKSLEREDIHRTSKTSEEKEKKKPVSEVMALRLMYLLQILSRYIAHDQTVLDFLVPKTARGDVKQKWYKAVSLFHTKPHRSNGFQRVLLLYIHSSCASRSFTLQLLSQLRE
jgi:hypothetical protein